MSPRTEEQLYKLKEEKRGLILMSALKVFANEGIQMASVAKIALEAGISKGLIYTYFKNKEDLLRELVLGTIADMFDIALVAMGETPDSSSFTKMINDYFNWVEENIQFLKVYFGFILQPDVVKVFEKEMFEMAWPLFEKMSVYFKNKGSDQPLSEVRFFVSIMDGVYMNYIMDPDNYPLEYTRKKLLHMFT